VLRWAKELAISYLTGLCGSVQIRAEQKIHDCSALSGLSMQDFPECFKDQNENQ
jgi:hypothetical protein